MPKLVGSLAAISLDLKKVSQKLQEESEEILRACTHVWVQTVIDIVPVWSGMSQASLTNLIRAADLDVFVPNSPLAPGAPNRVDEGIALGEGDFIISKKQFAMVFTTAVPHMAISEEYPLNPGNPYYFRKAANAAFEQEFKRRLDTFRFDIGPYIRVETETF